MFYWRISNYQTKWTIFGGRCDEVFMSAWLSLNISDAGSNNDFCRSTHKIDFELETTGHHIEYGSLAEGKKKTIQKHTHIWYSRALVTYPPKLNQRFVKLMVCKVLYEITHHQQCLLNCYKQRWKRQCRPQAYAESKRKSIISNGCV